MTRRKRTSKQQPHPHACTCHPNPVFTFIRAGLYLLNWPFHWLSGHIMRAFKAYGAPMVEHHHKLCSVALGLILVTISVLIQHWFSHPVWTVGVETAKAAGVCPLWEAIAAIITVKPTV